MQITTAIPVAGVDTGVTTEVEDTYGAWLVANGYATKGKAQRTGAAQDRGTSTPTPTPSGTPTTQAGGTTPTTSGQGKGSSTKKSSTKSSAK